MPVMQQCPDDHPLMIAWKSYQATEEYQNSYKWATAAIEHVVLPEPTDPAANRITEDNYRQYVQGSLWAAFMAGFDAASALKTRQPE
jgi:alkyl sulfatase BDS1-like metallo-beta-lactamase superfamily hydrolase